MSGYRAPCVLLAAAVLALTSAPVAADPAGRTTLEESIGLSAQGGIQMPVPAPGAPFEVHAAGGVTPGPVRASRRRSLAFFAQLTDAQLADEMSPARLEFLRPAGVFGGAWRPHEALGPQTFDQAVRNVNANAVSPVPDGAGTRAALGFAVVTGDLSDNHQHNEVRWGVSILEGGRVDPFSGSRVGPGNRCPGASRRAVGRMNAAVASRRYTGVQDYDDYPQRPATAYASFYDPDTAAANGPYGALQRYPGLMERAQRPFRAAGLRVPWFAARGNHDALAQGFNNPDAFHASTYFHRPPGGRIVLGPLWDFDIATGNTTLDRFRTTRGWHLGHRPYVERLYRDRWFVRRMADRWRELRAHGLRRQINVMISRDVRTLRGPHERNFQRWAILGRYVWPNPVDPRTGRYRPTWMAEVRYLRRWVNARIAWIDRALPARAGRRG